MTPVQLHAARMLIPGAFEPNAPLHRAKQPMHPGPVVALQEPLHLPTVDVPHVVAAPSQPTTPLGFTAATLGEIVLYLALLYGVALALGLAVKGIEAGMALILGLAVSK
jgi:hypothetical protein